MRIQNPRNGQAPAFTSPGLRALAFSALAALAVTFPLAGCGQNGSSQQATSAGEPAAGSTDWTLEAMPDGAVGVAQVKANASEGQAVVMTGVVGGRVEPITAESGLFLVMDPSIPSCADMAMGGDGCETPWDYCCESPESKKANNATVQLRDAEGNPIALGERIKPLDTVTVKGVVGPRPSADALVVYASGMYVQPYAAQP